MAGSLAAIGLGAAEEGFWNAVRPKATRLKDVARWWIVCHGAAEPVIADPALVERAAALLPGGPWDETTWERWVGAIETTTGHRGKALIRPLGLALTGLEHGPALKNLLPMIGRDRALARLEGRSA